MATQNNIPQTSGDLNIIHFELASKNKEFFIRAWVNGNKVLIPLKEIEDGILEPIDKIIPEGASEDNKLALSSELYLVPNGGNKTESDLVQGVLAIGGAGSWYKLTLTTVQAVIIRANGGIPNFAITIDNSGNTNDVEVTVTNEDGTSTLMYASAGGNKINAGTVVQLTAVGDCFAIAEFSVPVNP